MPAIAGSMTSRITRACTAGVTTGAGEYAPMPPVFGPWSPSSSRLWSWLVASGSAWRAVGDDDEARFLAFEKFLDDDARAGRAHAIVDEHHVDRGVRFGGGRRDDDAFAGGEAVGLDDDRRARAVDVLVRRRRIA